MPGRPGPLRRTDPGHRWQLIRRHLQWGRQRLRLALRHHLEWRTDDATQLPPSGQHGEACFARSRADPRSHLDGARCREFGNNRVYLRAWILLNEFRRRTVETHGRRKLDVRSRDRRCPPIRPGTPLPDELGRVAGVI
jgi:hypothetical protein